MLGVVEPIIPGTEKILPGAACCAGLMALDGVNNICL